MYIVKFCHSYQFVVKEINQNETYEDPPSSEPNPKQKLFSPASPTLWRQAHPLRKERKGH